MGTKKEGTVLLHRRVHPISIAEEVQWILEDQVTLICLVEAVGLQDPGTCTRGAHYIVDFDG